MIILANARAIQCGRRTKLSVDGGTGPYIWSVVPAAAGQTIAGGTVTSSGLYTAPQNVGIDTVKVVDSLGAEATIQIAVQNVFMIVCDIIAREMGLASDQVFLWNQTIPVLSKDKRLYIAVGVLTSRPFASISEVLSDGTEQQIQNLRTVLTIDVMSYGTDARDRKEEVAMALGSLYAQQQQEANSFMISRLSGNIANLSSVEGSKIPHRFNITATIQHMVIKTKNAAYFDTVGDAQITEEP